MRLEICLNMWAKCVKFSLPFISPRLACNGSLFKRMPHIIVFKVGDKGFEIKSIELQKSDMYDKTDAKM